MSLFPLLLTSHLWPLTPGEAYFNASQVPMLYFTVLLLSQQFEAVRSLFTFSLPHLLPSPFFPFIMYVQPGYPDIVLVSLQAIEFLSRIEPFQSHAIHFAIGLQELQLLRLTESSRSRLCKILSLSISLNISLSPPLTGLSTVVRDNEGSHRLNYARLVISYTRRFSQTDPREALQYFFLLKVGFCDECVSGASSDCTAGDGGERWS